MASCIFHAVTLPQAMDSKAGSLNDTSVDEYSKIEGQSKLTSCIFGKTILRPRHNVARARKIANGLVDHLFRFEIEEMNDEPLVEEYLDMVMFDPE